MKSIYWVLFVSIIVLSGCKGDDGLAGKVYATITWSTDEYVCYKDNNGNFSKLDYEGKDKKFQIEAETEYDLSYRAIIGLDCATTGDGFRANFTSDKANEGTEGKFGEKGKNGEDIHYLIDLGDPDTSDYEINGVSYTGTLVNF